MGSGFLPFLFVWSGCNLDFLWDLAETRRDSEATSLHLQGQCIHMGLSCFSVLVPEDPPSVEVIPGRFLGSTADCLPRSSQPPILQPSSSSAHSWAVYYKILPIEKLKSFILHETRGSLVGFTVSTSSYLKIIACLKGYSNPWIKSSKITKLVVWKKNHFTIFSIAEKHFIQL